MIEESIISVKILLSGNMFLFTKPKIKQATAVWIYLKITVNFYIFYFHAGKFLTTKIFMSRPQKVNTPLNSLLSKDTTSELAGLSPNHPFFMLNVKQESCGYQLLKSFGLTRPGNRTQVYRLLAQK